MRRGSCFKPTAVEEPSLMNVRTIIMVIIMIMVLLEPAHPFEVDEAPPDHFLLAHVFTLAGAISMGTMARKLVRPQ